MFQSNRTGPPEVYVINGDGTGLRQLTKGSTSNFAPAWSPDGRTIAFVSSRSGHASIYLMSADGRNQRRLTKSRANEFNPGWSPDARRIAFESYRATNEIYVVNVAGTGERRLTWSKPPKPNGFGNERANPAWSPNGELIAYDSRRVGRTLPALYVMHADGQEKRRLSLGDGEADQPTWSPDGHRIAIRRFAGAGHWGDDAWIAVMDVRTGKERALTRPQAEGGDRNPAWSPDGRQIAFDSDRNGASRIYVMDADGSNRRRLTGS